MKSNGKGVAEPFDIINVVRVRAFGINEDAKIEKWLNQLGDKKRYFKIRTVSQGSTILLIVSWAEFVKPENDFNAIP